MGDYFQDKVVVITGGAGGLGQTLSQQLIAQGAKVAALDLDISMLENTDNMLPIKTDITDISTIEFALDKIVNQFGKIDILINNAGITHMSRFVDTDEALFEKIMTVNFTGSVNITRLALPYLTETQGQIIALSSVAGFAPLYGRSAYAASKHAMEGFFQSLASELADNDINVLIVRPSFIKTRPELQAQVNAGESSPGAIKKSTNGEQIKPEVAASKILKAAENNQAALQLGSVSRIAYWLNALVPGLYRKVMTKGAKKEFQ
ncbi:SDR family oxidoreductase [Maricurvus nonylphenolicus]|uniref:SDR family oxidoreductase n=1 Tax=Maricurvus nonylphenolicus TaxID=1008307 RepID=UPI0036F35890